MLSNESQNVVSTYCAIPASTLRWTTTPRLPGVEPQAKAPWWRDVRLWASFVAVAQIVVYALLS